MNTKSTEKQTIDWMITLVPFFLILVLCIFFFCFPDSSNAVLTSIRTFLGDSFSVYYLLIGIGCVVISLYLSFSKYGDIVLGDKGAKPKYSFWAWGSMMFTAGLAADIVFYSFCEWVLYWDDPHTLELGRNMDWASTFTLFHWGPTVWSFYLVLAVAFGFMLHVRKRTRQKYSEACRPILGKYTDGLAGRLIDLLAVFALLAGTATTFSVATPLLSEAIRAITGVGISDKSITIAILIVTCVIYTYSVMKGMGGISSLANVCTLCFYGLLLYVLFFGGQAKFILETGLSAIGRLTQYFPSLSTYTDPLRETGFAQNWTVFYWAYWMVWCVAAPFFIGSISEKGILDIVGLYRETENLYTTIIEIIRTLPMSTFVLVLLIVTMIAFYATSFDSIALVASQYSYHALPEGAEPSGRLKSFWSILLILLPVALIFSDSSMANLQSVSIIAAFPIGIVIVLIIASFMKDARDYLSA